MKILYLGDSSISSTSYHRYKSLIRRGASVEIRNPFTLTENNIISKLHYRTGYKFIQKRVLSWFNDIVNEGRGYDLIWVNSGELFGVKSIEYLKFNFKCPVILYNNDDPTGGRDGRRFNSLLKAIPSYDLCVVMRESNIQEYIDRGAKDVLRVMMSYDEILHSAKISPQLVESKRSDVAFIGTWMRHEKRDEFILQLIRAGINVSIWGNRWNKSPHWDRLKTHFRGSNLSGEDYVAAIQGAKLCLGLLSKGNRDMHTTRTMEVPYAGGVLFAERTKEHLELYNDGEEAVFWTDIDDCIEKCKVLLSNEVLLQTIKNNGMKRVLINRVGNEDVCQKIIDYIFSK